MIGILGGTFDPIHYGHLRPALEVVQALGLERLHIVPCGIPPHRSAPPVSADHRLRMVEIACAGEPVFFVDGREIGRDGPSFTVDTLRELRAEVGDAEPICLLIGMDAFRAINTWSRWEEISRLAHVVVMARAGSGAPLEGPVAELLVQAGVDNPDALHAVPSGRVLVFPVTRLDISATQVREELAQGRTPRYLLPDGVLEYIHGHGLYAQMSGKPTST